MKFSSFEQPVCAAMYVLPRSGYCWYNAGGSGPNARVWKTNATHITGEQESYCSSQSNSSGWPPADLTIRTPPSFPSSIQTSWMRKSVFSKCCEMYIFNIISWLYICKQRLRWQPAGRQELYCRRASLQPPTASKRQRFVWLPSSSAWFPVSAWCWCGTKLCL